MSALEAIRTTTVLFNRNDVIKHREIEQPPQDEVKNTVSLWQADLETAVKYGGELTRAALGAMEIRHDKTHVLVDTKVHMLMPGQCPAIPGWHTDGVPREIIATATWDRPGGGTGRYSSIANGPPNLEVQETWDAGGRAPRFHLLVTGKGCLTEFLTRPLLVEVPANPTSDLYAHITRFVREEEEGRPDRPTVFREFAPSCTAVEWDWWNLHQGVIATRREWRFLIRVTESDYHEPKPPSKLREIIRTQQMVYTPLEFGW